MTWATRTDISQRHYETQSQWKVQGWSSRLRSRAMQAMQLGIRDSCWGNLEWEELKPSDSGVYRVETNKSCFLHEAGTSENPNWIAKSWKMWETVKWCKASFALPTNGFEQCSPFLAKSYWIRNSVHKKLYLRRISRVLEYDCLAIWGLQSRIVIFISYHPTRFHCFKVTSQEDKDQPHTSLARAVLKNSTVRYLIPQTSSTRTL